ncbi:hypothetical protein C8R47DRAFT_786650 [Mycena vitilis]|nr:hypothetical protein C8R47DRAFT_786650 [Mycena vitilis]
MEISWLGEWREQKRESAVDQALGRESFDGECGRCSTTACTCNHRLILYVPLLSSRPCLVLPLLSFLPFHSHKPAASLTYTVQHAHRIMMLKRTATYPLQTTLHQENPFLFVFLEHFGSQLGQQGGIELFWRTREENFLDGVHGQKCFPQKPGKFSRPKRAFEFESAPPFEFSKPSKDPRMPGGDTTDDTTDDMRRAAFSR